MGRYIKTYTGKHFEPMNPDPEYICIEDIAHALSMLCRGNGHKVFLVCRPALYLLREGSEGKRTL